MPKKIQWIITILTFVLLLFLFKPVLVFADNINKGTEICLNPFIKKIIKKMTLRDEQSKVKTTYTIESIEPDMGNNYIYVKFSKSISDRHRYSSEKIKIFPPVSFSISYENMDTLRIYGEFKHNQKYTIQVDQSLKSEDGSDYTATKNTFVYPDFPPSIEFYNDGDAIELHSRQLLHTQIRNVNEIIYQGIDIPAALLPEIFEFAEKNAACVNSVFQSYLLKYSERSKKLYEASKRVPLFSKCFRPALYERQTFFSENAKNIFHQYSIPLTFRSNNLHGGVLLTRLAAGENDAAPYTKMKIFRISDIASHCRSSKKNILIHTTSLSSGKSISNAQIFLYAKDSIYYAGQTDKDGILILDENDKFENLTYNSTEFTIVPQKKRALNPEDIESIFIYSGEDWTFLDKSFRTIVELPKNHDFRQIQETISNNNNYEDDYEEQDQNNTSTFKSIKFSSIKSSIFTERGIYKPGESVFYKIIVRKFESSTGNAYPAKDLPLLITVSNSKGENIYSKKINCNEFGSVYDTVFIKPYFPTGKYNILVRGGADDANLNEYSFEVQDIRPPRHYVEINAKQCIIEDSSYAGAPVKINAAQCLFSSKYYVGGPLKHGQVRWEIYLSPNEYTVENFDTYYFGYPRLDDEMQLIESTEVTLDEKGEVRVYTPIGTEILSGMKNLYFTVSALDFDGRISSASQFMNIMPEYKIGVSRFRQTILPGERQALEIIVLDKENKPVQQGSLQVSLSREGRAYVRKRLNTGQFDWNYQRVWSNILSSEIRIENGLARYDFDIAKDGIFAVTFKYTDNNGNEYVSGAKFVSGTGSYYDYDYNSERTKLKYCNISVIPEKKNYKPGDTVKVKFYSPKKLATCLVTVERDKILEYKIIDCQNSEQAFELKASDYFSPNVFISVSGSVKRLRFPDYSFSEDNSAPESAWGGALIEITEQNKKMNIEINNNKNIKAKPGEQITFTIKTTDSENKGIISEVAVAAVDEGVLSMTGYQTPDMEDLMKFLLPLEVSGYDNRQNILLQVPYQRLKQKALTGGDGDGSSASKAMDITRKDFRPVAFFHPAILTDNSGTVKISFKLPDLVTSYRLIAVACDKTSLLGSTEIDIEAVKDFYIEPGLPQFFTEGDSFIFNTAAFNKTASEISMNFSIKSQGYLNLTTEGHITNINPYDRKIIKVKGKAEKTGPEKIIFSSAAADYCDIVQKEISVQPRYLMDEDIVFSDFVKNGNIQYLFPVSSKKIKFIPDDCVTILSLSTNPVSRLSGGLKYLLEYPYGCVEQTSSKIIPLAGLRALLKRGLISGIDISQTDVYLKKGIERLFTMQTGSGGFGYWPGDNSPHQWGTIYAAAAISFSKKAGHEIPDDNFVKALAYLREIAVNNNSGNSQFNGFAAYILALNGRLNISDYETIRKKITGTNPCANILMMLASKTANFHTSRQLTDLLLINIKTIKKGNYDDNEFYLKYLSRSVSLLACAAICPDNKEAAQIAGELTQCIENAGRSVSTADVGWALMGLGEYYDRIKNNSKISNCVIQQAGLSNINVAVGFADEKIVFNSAAFIKNSVITVNSDNNNTLFARLYVKYPRNDYSDYGYSNGFKISKTIENMDGGKSIKVGDIVKVTVYIEAENPYNYVALDDPLPAGLAAISSAINTEQNIKKLEAENKNDYYNYYWDEGGFYRFAPDFFEIRYDRALAFRTEVWRGKYRYSYYCRAICAGRFYSLPAKVQAMYQPQQRGYSRAEVIEISDRE